MNSTARCCRRSTTTSRAPARSHSPGCSVACRVSGRELTDERIVVFGAGAGGLGIARQIRAGYGATRTRRRAIRERIAVLDSRGLIVATTKCATRTRANSRGRRSKRAASGSAMRRERGLDDVVEHFKPTVLIGASGQAGSFPEDADQPRRGAGRTADHLSAVESQRQHRGATGRHRAMDATAARSSPPEVRSSRLPTAAKCARSGRPTTPSSSPGSASAHCSREVREVTDNMINVAAASLAGCLTDAEIAEGSAVSVGATAARRGARRGDRRHQAGDGRRRRDEGHRRPRSRRRREHVGAGVPRLRLTRQSGDQRALELGRALLDERLRGAFVVIGHERADHVHRLEVEHVAQRTALRRVQILLHVTECDRRQIRQLARERGGVRFERRGREHVLTRPIFNASCAEITSAVKYSSRALAAPTRYGRK